MRQTSSASEARGMSDRMVSRLVWVVAAVALGAIGRFNRSRYDTQRVMEGFAGSLRDEVDGDEVVRGGVGVVSETMQPAAVGVWLREETAT